MTVKATKRTYAIAMILMTGVAPWGRDLGEPGMHFHPARRWFDGSREPARWAAWCGHVLTPAAMRVWIADGLAVELPVTEGGSRRVGPGPNLEAWISQAFDGLKVQHWGQTA